MGVKAPKLTHGSLFSGIGGFDLAFASLGIPTLWQVEIDPYCQGVLRENFPGVPLHSDIRGVGAKNLEKVDIITGGFPCQPFSQAGKKKGKGDSRYLWHEMLRVVVELKPRWVVAENVRGILSLDGGRHFEEVCADLEAQGYWVTPFLLPACAVDAPHRRDRVWILAHADRQHGKGWAVHEACGQAGPSDIGEGWWEAEPGVGRVADGIPLRTHRLRCLGNAVVPQVAAWIGAQIARHEALGSTEGGSMTKELAKGIAIAPRHKADPVSASKPTKAIDLTPSEERVIKEFIKRGKALDKRLGELVALGIKVKAIFASKPRRTHVIFEGRQYLTFDQFVEENLAVSGRHMRRLLAKEGKTDQRFANKKPKLPECASASEPGESRPKPEEKDIKSALGIPQREPLPEMVRKAYEIGYENGYDEGYADGRERQFEHGHEHVA